MRAVVSRAETENESAAENVTSLCTVAEPSGRLARRLTDGNVETYSEIKPDGLFRAAWGEDAPVKGAYLEFYESPSAITVTELDASGAAISEQRVDEPLLNDYYPLSANARGVEVRSDEAMTLAEAAFYGAGRTADGRVRLVAARAKGGPARDIRPLRRRAFVLWRNYPHLRGRARTRRAGGVYGPTESACAWTKP